MQTTAHTQPWLSSVRSRLVACREAVCRRVARAGTPVIVSCCTAIVLFGQPVLALAQEEDDVRDARLEGYASKVSMDTGGNGLTWIAFIIMAVIGVSALFKSSKRSHLD